MIVEWSGMQPRGSLAAAQNDLLETNLLERTTNDRSPPPVFPSQCLNALYDGKLYSSKASPAWDFEGSFSVRDGKSVTFVLDTSVNKSGYTINMIDVYTSHDCGRTGQKYEVEFSQVGRKDWLASPVVKVDRRTLYDNLSLFFEARSRIRSRAPEAPLATGVGRIRFTFHNQYNPYYINQKPEYEFVEGMYREIDVFGSPTISAPAPNQR